MSAKRFGQIVTARREQLDLTQIDVWQRGGPSNSTLTAIEAGTGKPSPSTFRKLDRALEWVPGSARRAFDGEDPSPLAGTPAAPPNVEHLTDDQLIDALRERMRRYAASATNTRDGRAVEVAPTSEVLTQLPSRTGHRQPGPDPPG